VCEGVQLLNVLVATDVAIRCCCSISPYLITATYTCSPLCCTSNAFPALCHTKYPGARARIRTRTPFNLYLHPLSRRSSTRPSTRRGMWT